MYLQNLGTLQLYLSADAFATCASAKPPQNTLFEVERVGSISFEDMQKYMDLIVGLFELCPTGTWEQNPKLYACIFFENYIYICILKKIYIYILSSSSSFPSGEFSILGISHWFSELDNAHEGRLSHRTTVREAKNWCNDDLRLPL